MMIRVYKGEGDVPPGLLEFGRTGVTHFILSGWPKLEEMAIFGTAVLPLIRAAERSEAGAEGFMPGVPLAYCR